jgi:hypothetical protein
MDCTFLGRPAVDKEGASVIAPALFITPKLRYIFVQEPCLLSFFLSLVGELGTL